MAHFAEELKTSSATGKPGEETKNMKDAVKNTVRGYAETVKQWEKEKRGHYPGGRNPTSIAYSN
jgi:hypothetical protein